MRSRARRYAPAWAMAVTTIFVAGPAFGAAFSIFEQGTKAMGMAGAFTAQADDPSAMFHNAAGLAFMTERDIAVGVTYIRSLEAELIGADPFPGAGYTAEQETLSEFPPHAYWVQPLSTGPNTRNWTFGIGVNAPFGLTTEWEDPTGFRGRFVSQRAALQAVDINPTIGLAGTPTFGIGFGGIARLSSVELERHVPQFNPFTQTICRRRHPRPRGQPRQRGLRLERRAAPQGHLALHLGPVVPQRDRHRLRGRRAADPEPDRHAVRPAGRRPSFRSASTFPVETAIAFPDPPASASPTWSPPPCSSSSTSTGPAGRASRSSTSSSRARAAQPDDPAALRGRLPLPPRPAHGQQPGLQWRAGVVFDETPQPEEAVSPLLPDADRWGFTLGYGHQGRVDFDVAVMYLIFDERTRATSFADEPASTFFGTYNQEAVLVGLTLGF
jgi:long-chain fatty acid transport protein